MLNNLDSEHEVKLTAYALGELDEAERSEIERELTDNIEERAYVEEVRAQAKLVQAAMEEETAREPLRVTEHAALARRTSVRWVPFAIAASLFLLIGFGTMLVMRQLSKTTE